MLFWTNPGSSSPQNSSSTATCLTSQKPSNWIRRIRHAGHFWRRKINSLATFSNEFLILGTVVQTDPQRFSTALFRQQMQSRGPTRSKECEGRESPGILRNQQDLIILMLLMIYIYIYIYIYVCVCVCVCVCVLWYLSVTRDYRCATESYYRQEHGHMWFLEQGKTQCRTA